MWRSIETTQLKRSGYDHSALALAALFQYALGNTDYSFLRGPAGDDCCHNLVPVRDARGVVLPIPYDFDSTGLVDPPYAVPAEGLKIRKVTQRLYRGYCSHAVQTQAARQVFLARRQEIDALVENFTEVPGLERERVSGYLEQFFSTLVNEASFEKRVTKRCR